MDSFVQTLLRHRKTQEKDHKMITLEQIKQKQAEVDKLVKQYESQEVEQKCSVWKPEEGEIYFAVNELGRVNEQINNEPHFMEMSLLIGNVFKTKEEAKRELEKRKILQELKELAGCYEWREGEQNYFLLFNGKIFDVDCDESFKTQGVIYFDDHDCAIGAIDTLGEEKLKILFGIKEG